MPSPKTLSAAAAKLVHLAEELRNEIYQLAPDDAPDSVLWPLFTRADELHVEVKELRALVDQFDVIEPSDAETAGAGA